MNRSNNSRRLRWPIQLLALCALLLPIAFAGQAQAGSAPAATTIGADILSDTLWTSAGSPYIVVAPIRVASAATLTIEAGVVVEFAPSAGLRVEGGLNAQGTPTQPVQMIGGNNAAWQGITIAQPSKDIVLRSVTLRNAVAALAIRQQALAVTKTGRRVEVSESLFDHNSIGMNADYSITANAPRLILRNNLLTNNGIGLQLNGLPNGNLKPKFNHNSFTGNAIGVKALNISGKGPKMQQHWWGSTGGPLVGSPGSCANPPAPGTSSRDQICGNVDFAPWSKVPAGRVIIPAGQGMRLESGLGQAALSDDDSAPTSIITVTVPPGAFAHTVDLVATPRGDLPFVPPTLSTSLGFEITAVAGEQEIHQFANGQHLSLEISYTAADLAGIDPQKLAVYYYDETRKLWSTAGIATQPDPAKNRIIVQLAHLTRFRTSLAGPKGTDMVELFLPLVQ